MLDHVTVRQIRLDAIAGKLPTLEQVVALCEMAEYERAKELADAADLEAKIDALESEVEDLESERDKLQEAVADFASRLKQAQELINK